MEEHLTPSDDPGQEDAGAESSPDADPTLALLGQYVRDHWTHAAPAKKCVVSPWDPTCSGKPFRPARPSFPDLERSFPGLERYLHKHRQDKGGYKDALRQMIEGKKAGCWIWWILPQVSGEVQHHAGDQCCQSEISKEFALESLYEAIAFLCHPELGKNFFNLIRVIRYQIEPRGHNGGRGRTLNELFGESDAQKVRCSVTLFRRLAGWCYPLSPESYANLIADCDAILVAALRDGHRPCDHVPELYQQFQESLEVPRERAKMQKMFPLKCNHCGGSVWPPDEDWNLWHKWCVEENFLTSNQLDRGTRLIWQKPYTWQAVMNTFELPRATVNLSIGAIQRNSLRNPTINKLLDEPRLDSLAVLNPGNVVNEAQQLASYQIDVLHLGIRARNCLQRAGIRTVGELASRTAEELLAIRNMGVGSVKEIQTKLLRFKNRMGSGDWDGSPPVRLEPQKTRHDWLQNLAEGDDAELENLGLDPTLVSFLEGNDIRGVAQLVSHTEEELMAVKFLGSEKVTKIRAGLERFGWRLGDISGFSEGLDRLRSALADQAQEAEYEQREAKGLVWPLVSDGSSVDRIVESTGLSEAAVREARNAWMVEQRIAGASNRAIGETVGMSAEAVRRSIKRADNIDSGHIRELRAERLTMTIRDIVTSMPGSGLGEIAEKAGISRTDVRRNLTRLGTKLVWGVNRRNHSRVKKWSNEQLLQALRTASTGSTPLTVAAYDALVTRNRIDGPTGQVFFLRFGSWKMACEAAGVQCGEPARDNYTRKSEADLEALVVEFLFSSEHDGSLVDFQRWLDERPDYPSMATVRNRLGHWDSMKQKAIEEIVASGRLDELCALCD